MKNKNDYLKILEEKYQNLDALTKMKEQLNNYFAAQENYKLPKHPYQLNDEVILKKGMLMHGTLLLYS